MALHGITVCLDLTHPSSEINKSPKPGIERELVWFAIDRRPLRPRLASLLSNRIQVILNMQSGTKLETDGFDPEAG